MKESIIIVIGGSSGIGFSLIKKLLEKRKKVLNIDLTLLDSSSIRNNSNFFQYIIDENETEGLQKCINSYLENDYTLESLAITAGKGYTTSLDDMTIEQFQREINDNLISVYNYISILKKYLKNGQAVVLTGSVASYGFSGSSAAYSASKAAIVGLTKNLAMSLGENGTRVNCVIPGNVETKLFNNLTTKIERDTLSKLTPLKKNAVPDEIADGIEFFLSSNSTHITGQTLVIDGGLSLSYRPFI